MAAQSAVFFISLSAWFCCIYIVIPGTLLCQMPHKHTSHKWKMSPYSQQALFYHLHPEHLGWKDRSTWVVPLCSSHLLLCSPDCLTLCCSELTAKLCLDLIPLKPQENLKQYSKGRNFKDRALLHLTCATVGERNVIFFHLHCCGYISDSMKNKTPVK